MDVPPGFSPLVGAKGGAELVKPGIGDAYATEASSYRKRRTKN